MLLEEEERWKEEKEEGRGGGYGWMERGGSLVPEVSCHVR